ncbi:hypothetical protein QBC38DRAFT_449879 [Podospora fimiseda]|uniref:Uncharacterized protein n=1 Tax=Podospora fimiseda TaxID=252190 RepID=A0AAN7BCE3_9PEZI|nr:hypothetical protein QBC38DRAFT_449879 [Podospora fimiseda]
MGPGPDFLTATKREKLFAIPTQVNRGNLIVECLGLKSLRNPVVQAGWWVTCTLCQHDNEIVGEAVVSVGCVVLVVWEPFPALSNILVCGAESSQTFPSCQGNCGTHPLDLTNTQGKLGRALVATTDGRRLFPIVLLDELLDKPVKLSGRVCRKDTVFGVKKTAADKLKELIYWILWISWCLSQLVNEDLVLRHRLMATGPTTEGTKHGSESCIC